MVPPNGGDGNRVGPDDILNAVEGAVNVTEPHQEVGPGEVLAEAGGVGDVQELTPTQRAGLYLAAGVGALIGLVTLLLAYDWLMMHLALALSMDSLPQDKAKADRMITAFASLNDAVVSGPLKIFDQIVVRALLPVFTAILGYIFGTQVISHRRGGS